MELLVGTVRNYDWGSRSLIAEMQGRPAPSEKPEAEIWYGAHPSAPSVVGTAGLDELIQEDSLSNLGKRVSSEFDNKLPFLLKILAAGSPLSLQAHPSLKQAQEGFKRENQRGIDIQAKDRNYRDDNHKPELVVALTDFIAMAGFRPLSETLEIFDALNCEQLDQYRDFIDLIDEQGSIEKLLECWINLPADSCDNLITALVSSAHLSLNGNNSEKVEFVLTTVLSLYEKYPRDNGVLVALLLNFYSLSPGEGIYLDAGNLHAYVSGLAVEIMANSDNVLRGGLTTKHVDVPELVRVLNFEPLEDARVQVHQKNEVMTYSLPIGEFKLDKIMLNGMYCVDKDGPVIILCTEGMVELSCGDQKIILGPTDAAWVPSSDGAVLFECKNAEVFIAHV